MFGSAEQWRHTLEDELGEPFRAAAAQWMGDQPGHEARENGTAVQPAERLLDALLTLDTYLKRNPASEIAAFLRKRGEPNFRELEPLQRVALQTDGLRAA